MSRGDWLEWRWNAGSSLGSQGNNNIVEVWKVSYSPFRRFAPTRFWLSHIKREVGHGTAQQVGQERVPRRGPETLAANARASTCCGEVGSWSIIISFVTDRSGR